LAHLTAFRRFNSVPADPVNPGPAVNRENQGAESATKLLK
jgi:hypothetical protein